MREREGKEQEKVEESGMETDRGQAMIQQGKAHVIHLSHIEFRDCHPPSLSMSIISFTLYFITQK